MSDVQVIDLKTGRPKPLPPEAVATAHAKGEIAFAPGTRVPVILQGQPGTLSPEEADAAVKSGDATLNFDPSGSIKAGALGAVRGLTFGASDWAAIEGQKLLGDPEGAEHTRKVLEGLKEEHAGVSSGAEVLGGLGGLLVPGEDVAEGANLAHIAETGGALVHGAEGAEALDGASAALQAKHAAEATQAAQTAAEVKSAADVATQAAKADATSGRTVGSALGSLFRHSAGAPQALVGRLGAGAEDILAPLFGDKAAALARWGTEGAIIDYANSADESELGDTPLTGEAILASMERGALFGGALGLVGTGAERVLTGAGRLANRVAEGRLGGSAGQYRKALGRWGPGSLGLRSLEEGIETPFATGAEKYERAQSVVSRDGQQLSEIAKEADANYNGMSASESRSAYHAAIDKAAEEGALAGGPMGALSERLKGEYDKAIGWVHDPAPLDPLPPNSADHLYDAAWRKEGLPDPALTPPTPVTKGRVDAQWAKLAKEEGLGTRLEKPPMKIRPAELESYRQQLVARFQASSDRAEKAAIGIELGSPDQLLRNATIEAQAHAAIRNSRRGLLRQKAIDELNSHYASERDTYQRVMARHSDLKTAAAKHVANLQGQRDFDLGHLTSSIRRSNAERKVPFQTVRAFRSKLDEIIPYNRGTDALTNAAVEMKRAARSALEGHVEASMEASAKRGGHDTFARYVHAKARYGQAKDIEAMLERQRGREASRFGREVFGHYGGIMGHAVGGLVFGHPMAGAVAGAAKQYAPSALAWATHKLGKLAEMKALRADLLVALRRSTRAAAAGREAETFAQVAVPHLPPHELRMTAAEAMVAISKTAKRGDLTSRLAALDPHMLVIAPKAAQAVDGAARRQLTWMLSRIPARIQQAIAQGHEPTSKDITDNEARDFMEGMAVAHDPRVATDALAKGQLTPNMLAGQKAVWSAVHMQTVATAQRQAALDKHAFEGLPAGKRSQFSMLGVSSMPMPPPGMTLALQKSAVAATSAGNAKASPGGQVHAASGLAKSSQASMTATLSDTLEQNSPGQRKRAGH